MCLQVMAKNFDAARAGLYKGQQHADGSGFAGAVLSQEAIYIALVHRKRQVINRFYIAKVLGELIDLYYNRHQMLQATGLRPILNRV